VQQSAKLYRISLSAVGGLIIGALGVLVGAAWAWAVGAPVLPVAVGLGAVAAIWGMVCVQLTPTGGVILENRTTVNYAVFALHGWMTFLACVLALVVFAVRSAL
jgi:hypothetical protein